MKKEADHNIRETTSKDVNKISSYDEMEQFQKNEQQIIPILKQLDEANKLADITEALACLGKLKRLWRQITPSFIDAYTFDLLFESTKKSFKSVATKETFNAITTTIDSLLQNLKTEYSTKIKLRSDDFVCNWSPSSEHFRKAYIDPSPTTTLAPPANAVLSIQSAATNVPETISAEEKTTSTSPQLENKTTENFESQKNKTCITSATTPDDKNFDNQGVPFTSFRLETNTTKDLQNQKVRDKQDCLTETKPNDNLVTNDKNTDLNCATSHLHETLVQTDTDCTVTKEENTKEIDEDPTSKNQQQQSMPEETGFFRKEAFHFLSNTDTSTISETSEAICSVEEEQEMTPEEFWKRKQPKLDTAVKKIKTSAPLRKSEHLQSQKLNALATPKPIINVRVKLPKKRKKPQKPKLHEIVFIVDSPPKVASEVKESLFKLIKADKRVVLNSEDDTASRSLDILKSDDEDNETLYEIPEDFSLPSSTKVNLVTLDDFLKDKRSCLDHPKRSDIAFMLSENSSLYLVFEDFARYKENQFTTNRVIDAFFFLLSLKCKELQISDETKQYFFFKTEFGAMLHETDFDWKRFETKKLKLYFHATHGTSNPFEMDNIVIPFNPAKNHWCTYLIRPKAKTVHRFDSRHDTKYRTWDNLIKKYLSINAIVFNVEFDQKKMTFFNATGLPQQDDEVNCGFYACYFAYVIAFEEERWSAGEWNFNNHDFIADLREQVFTSIIEKDINIFI